MSRLLLAACLSPALLLSSDARPPRQQGQLSGERALTHVRTLVAFGSRTPGSEGSLRARNHIRRQLQRLRVAVEETSFDAATPRGSVRMTNFIAKIPGRRADIVVLAGHYDTVHTQLVPGFVGANDGGSSTALLLELARVLVRRPNELSIWLVFFDGEEALEQWSAQDGLYGSRYLADQWRREGILRQIRAFILLDMIGDRELRLRRELNSTLWLVDLVWQAARDLGHAAHFVPDPLMVEDDHLPFARAGVPVVDLIDFDYGPTNRYWHSPDDTLDKLSARSLEVVGEVVLETLRRLEKN